MATFTDVGANCFLGSKLMEKIVAPNPSTERGRTLHINGHPKEPKIIYPSAKLIVVKSLVDPSDCFVYRGHLFMTTVAKFSPNGYWVASADISGKVKVWSWDNPEHLLKLETSVFGGPVYDLDWDSESKRIVAVGDSSGIQVKCFSWDTGNTIGEMLGPTKRVLTVSYKPSRPFRVITGGEDFQTFFYAGPPFKLDHSNSQHTNFVNCVRYSPSGHLAAAVSTDKKIQFYNGTTGQPTTDIPQAHDGGVYSVSFSPDGKQLATASADKTVKVWDCDSMQLLRVFAVSEHPQLSDAQMAVLWTAGQLVSVSLNGNINLFDVTSADDKPAKVIQSHQTPITALCLDRASGRLVTGSADGVVVIRSARALQEAFRLQGPDPARNSICCGLHNGKVAAMALVEDGQVLVSAGWDDMLRFSSPGSGGSWGSEMVPLKGQPCAMSASGDLLAVVTADELVLFRGRRQVSSLSLGFSPLCVGLREDLQELALGGGDCKTHLYRLSGDALALQITQIAEIPTRSAVSAVAYSPDGALLAVGDVGRQVEVHSRVEGGAGGWVAKVSGQWVDHTSRITCLGWAPAGDRLASGSLDENIYVWTLNKTGGPLQLPYTHAGGVTGVEWLDDTSLISSGNDQCLVTWKLPPVV